MSRIDEAKACLSDVHFSPDQVSDLHEMLDALRPTVDGGAPRGSAIWPWQRYHPWRHAIGRFFWNLGHRIMHGTPAYRKTES